MKPHAHHYTVGLPSTPNTSRQGCNQFVSSTERSLHVPPLTLTVLQTLIEFLLVAHKAIPIPTKKMRSVRRRRWTFDTPADYHSTPCLQEPTGNAIIAATIDGRFVIKGRAHGQKGTVRGYPLPLANVQCDSSFFSSSETISGRGSGKAGDHGQPNIESTRQTLYCIHLIL